MTRYDLEGRWLSNLINAMPARSTGPLLTRFGWCAIILASLAIVVGALVALAWGQ